MVEERGTQSHPVEIEGHSAQAEPGQARTVDVPGKGVSMPSLSAPPTHKQQICRHRRMAAQKHRDAEGRVAAICAQALERRWNELHYVVALHAIHRLLRGVLGIIETVLEGTRWEIPEPDGARGKTPSGRPGEKG